MKMPGTDSGSAKSDGIAQNSLPATDQITNGDHGTALDIPDNSHECEGQSPLPSARSENAEQNTQEPIATNETIIRRRHRKMNRPFYYLGGNNGTNIVDEYLSSLGWERINDRSREDYKLKWCEIKSHNNYCTFKEGEQLCYQIPNNKVLTTKIGLLTSLQEYERVMNKVKKGRPRIMKYQEFFPETYRLDVKEDRETFCEIYQDGEIWISKPTGLNQGKGIYLIRNREDINKFQVKMADIEEEVQTTRKLPFKIPMARIAQRYITNPLLLNGKKFDVRNYMLVASTQPLVVFYRDGYCRLTCLPYDEDSTDLTGHLTNQFMQKKNPLYQEVKDETVWSMDRFNDHVNEKFMKKKELPQDWVNTVLRKRCQQIMLHCFQSVRHKLECKLGFFDLYGCDFLVDDDFKVHLLEFNCNPALHTNCELLKEVIPSVVVETLQLSLEIFNKVKGKERIMPLASHNQFVLLYNGDLIEAEERREKLKAIAESRKRARSAQRRKKFMANFNVQQRYVYQNQRGSDGEAESTSTTQVTATSPTSATATYQTANNGPVALSSTGQNVTNRLYRVPQSTEISTNAGNLPSSVARSQTSLSGPSSMHSPTRVTASKSVPNIAQKKPFYAGGCQSSARFSGSVPSRPYSAPRFHRSKKTDLKNSNSIPCNNGNTEDEMVTEKSVAASLDAKLKEYRPIEPLQNSMRNEKDAAKNASDTDCKFKDQTQQTRGRRRERIKHIRSKSQENEALEYTEFDSMGEAEKNERIIEANQRLLEAMTSSAIQAPSAKLPLSYHSRTSLDSAYKPPQPSAVNIELREAPTKMPASSESFFQHHKLQYRNPSVRVRKTLQATTCTLEIGPKARRGLVAIPSAVPTVPMSQSLPTSLNNINHITRLRMMNAATATFPSPGVFDYGDVSFSQRTKSGLEDFHSQLQSMLASRPSEESNLSESRTRANCVDSSTQTPISNYTLSSEEKVIWRLRTKVGATANNARMSGRPSMPSNEAVHKDSLRSPAVGMKTPNGIQQSPRYIAVRPTLGNGVTMLISPPPVVSGKNMLPTIREGKFNSDSSGDNSSLYCEHGLTPQLSQFSQTPTSDGDDEIPSGAAIRTILNEVAEAKLEDNSERWMAPG